MRSWWETETQNTDQKSRNGSIERGLVSSGRRWAEVSIPSKLPVLPQWMYTSCWARGPVLTNTGLPAIGRESVSVSPFLLTQKWNSRGSDYHCMVICNVAELITPGSLCKHWREISSLEKLSPWMSRKKVSCAVLDTFFRSSHPRYHSLKAWEVSSDNESWFIPPSEMYSNLMETLAFWRCHSPLSTGKNWMTT